MKQKDYENFVIGLFVSIAATLALYWLYRQRREVSPAPLMVARDRSRLPTAELTPRPSPAPADDLELITGIGPVTARRFQEAGITTYAQLAALTPEELREISDTGRWEAADWIAEAKRRA